MGCPCVPPAVAYLHEVIQYGPLESLGLLNHFLMQNITKHPRNNGRSPITRLMFHIDNNIIVTCNPTNINISCILDILAV